MTVEISAPIYDTHFPDRMPRHAAVNDNILTEAEKARRIKAQAERDYARFIDYVGRTTGEFITLSRQQVEGLYIPGHMNLQAATTGSAWGCAHALFGILSTLEDANAMMIMEEINKQMQTAINTRREKL
ncbi:MAG: hypothetical protein WC130_03735 [Kiritimatiellia bacterium]